MRPDQHKKKRSAQYKKKHGTKEEDKGVEGGEKKKVDKQKLAQQSDRNVTEKPQIQQVKQVLQESAGAGAQAESIPSFRRREVVSNWTRYEGLDLPESGDDSETLRGADFRELLSVTTNSMSQFRFKDEQDWELDGEAEGSEEIADLLAVDLADLATAIHCIPLHTRLGLDTDMIQPQLMDQLNEEAAHNMTAYQDRTREINKGSKDKKVSVDITSDTLPETDDISHENNSDSHKDTSHGIESNIDSHGTEQEMDILDEILNDSNATMAKSKENKSNSICDKINTNLLPEAHTEVSSGIATANVGHSEPNECKSTKKHAAPDVCVSDNVEDDLDFLLCLDAPVKEADHQVKHNDHKERVPNQQYKADNKNKDQKSTIKPIEFKPAVTENLDDWLDSMLDD